MIIMIVMHSDNMGNSRATPRPRAKATEATAQCGIIHFNYSEFPVYIDISIGICKQIEM